MSINSAKSVLRGKGLRMLVTEEERRQPLFTSTLCALAVLAVPAAGLAETATIYGSLANFDVVNHTGQDAHGFEIELEGLHESDVVYSFSAERYGAPALVPTATGVRVRWSSPWNGNGFAQRTLPHAPNTPFAGTCYQWYPDTYDTAGCEHFGVSLGVNPLRTTYRWLVADPQAPGALLAVDPPTPIAGPVYTVVPPLRAGDPPAVAVEVEAPEPAEAPNLYGDAQWMKVYVTQVPHEVNLDELMADNPLVPQAAAQLESDFSLIQDEPVAGGTGNRKRKRNQGNLLPTTRAVIRRIEMSRYTGAYDPVTHEALCADLSCSAPSAGELGEFVSAQMTAVNVQSYSVTVAKTGDGKVESADRLIGCGSKCFAAYDRDAVVTLSAAPASGSVFSGWSGGCAGVDPTCTVAATGAVNVVANFAAVKGGGGGGGSGNPVLSVKTAGGKGLITGTPGTINCGKTCSTSVPGGTAVSLSATPEPGFIFVNWSGACTGTAPSCTVTVNGNVTAQANFTK